MREGHSVLEISKAIGVSDASLYNWLKKAGLDSGESKEQGKLTDIETENKNLKAEVRKLNEIKSIKPGKIIESNQSVKNIQIAPLTYYETKSRHSDPD